MTHMKTYKAVVKDQDGNIKIIESEYRRKADFIRDLRRNGYRVNPLKVKEKAKFDYVMGTTNCHPWYWVENYK